MNAYFKGQPIFGPRGPAGPDGNPIGTIISFMGLAAPTDYLVCDGSLYNVSDYPDLAVFFREHFGSETYFGEDGEGTFAVPDMRNLFLRGYHGEADDRLSGEIGEKQEGTIHVPTNSGSGWFGYRKGESYLQNADNLIDRSETFTLNGQYNPSNNPLYTYTSRPINMAVLYCIKATKEKPYEDIYSEEETIIGRWIDGRPLYRKVVLTTSPSSSGSVFYTFEDVNDIKFVNGYVVNTRFSNQKLYINTYYDSSDFISVIVREGTIMLTIGDSSYYSCPLVLILEYTKTTDPIPSAQTVERVITSRVPKPKSGTVTDEGEQYDYTMPDSAFAHASASSVGSFASSIASSVKDIFKEN